MGIPNHLTYFLRNLYVGQKTIVRTGHGTTDWFQIGKRVRQGCILSLYLFNLRAEYIMTNTRLDEAQARIKTAGRGDFPGGPVAVTPSSQCRGPGFDPWSGN